MHMKKRDLEESLSALQSLVLHRSIQTNMQRSDSRSANYLMMKLLKEKVVRVDRTEECHYWSTCIINR